ncbi:MAG: substrate-binding domain-containing protein [Gammaproteobacteria bacterium]|nr:substrate-binding domain-containing protein [Gammaproteobacteria bacterium]
MLRIPYLTMALCLGLLSPIANATTLTIPGSTTVQKRILEPAKASIEAQTGITVKVLGVGSGKGFKELMEGKAPVSIASSPLSALLKKHKLPEDGSYREHIIIQDVIVPIVHPSNSIDGLTHQQLADLNTGKIRNWKEVGGDDRSVVVVTSHESSATRAMFQKVVMNKAPYAEKARTVRSTRQEVDLVAKFKGGIGAVSKSFAEMKKGKVKVVQTDEITRPLCFITKGEPTAEVAKLLAFLKTPEAQQLFK